MKTFETSTAHKLTWRRGIGLKNTFELYSMDNIVGRLSIEPNRQISLAESAESSWIFRNSNFVSPNVSIWTMDTEFVAMFDGNREGNGILLFQDGTRIKWEKAQKLQSEWVFQNLVGESVLKVIPNKSDNRIIGTVITIPEYAESSNIIMLILLGWNIIYLLDSMIAMKSLTSKTF